MGREDQKGEGRKEVQRRGKECQDMLASRKEAWLGGTAVVRPQSLLLICPITLERVGRDLTFLERVNSGAIPGGPVIKTSPSNAGATGLIPCHVRSHLSHGQNTKTFKIKQKQYCNKDFKNSIKTLKMVHITKS